MDTRSNVTQLLGAWEDGDPTASEEFLALLYEELRKIAGDRMARDGVGHTLQPTALVHEAWIRLAKVHSENWKGRGHFLAAASEIMRRVLVDHARRRRSQKRGADAEHAPLGVGQS